MEFYTRAPFVNFSPIHGLNLAREDYRIQEIIGTRRLLLEVVKSFKAGRLEKQYDNNHIALDSVKRIVDLIG